MIGLLCLAGVVHASTDHEQEIQLDHWTRVVIGGSLIDVCVHDGGILNFYASVGHGSFAKFNKADGQDKDKDNITPFYSWNGSMLFYVNTPRGAAGDCILLIREP